MNVGNISGKTKIAGIVGNPVAHSLSPKIHNFLFEKFGIDAVYVPFQIENENCLGNFVKTFRSANFLGCNITIPYKSAILPFIDNKTKFSEITGTANTLYTENEKIYATTTDYAGFTKALEQDNFYIKDKNVLILGNGGTAKTLAASLDNPKNISLVGRNKEKVKKLAEEITDFDVSYFSFDEAKDVIWNADIIVNCTSAGMYPNIDESPVDISFVNPKTYLFDVIYNPLETKFLRDGKEKGCRVQNGLLMLIYQAFESFYVWTNKIDYNYVEELENLLLKEFD